MRLRLLGPFELRSDLGQSMPVGAPKRRTLLTALALELNQVVPLPRLIELVWDGSPPSTARAGIHVQVSALRKLLGRSTELVTRRPGYCLLAGPDTVDLH